MRLSILLVLELGLTVFSVPTSWSPDAAKFYSGVGNEILNIRQHEGPVRPTCDLSQVSLPQTSESLPGVQEDQRLLAVTIGRGTQNYTCESDDASIEPTARGALATLFDASCMASTYPYLLSLLPNIALQLSNPPASAESFGPTGISAAGRHYFSNSTTALFDMTELGAVYVVKEDAVDPPESAMQGTADQLNGAVGWLYLASIPESPGQAKSVYRVNTAGGKPPTNCSNQPDYITVDYAAQYWFYG